MLHRSHYIRSGGPMIFLYPTINDVHFQHLINLVSATVELFFLCN
jgi:hypothetical protein